MAAESLIRETAAALREHAPFSEMVATDVEFAARRVRLQYFAKDERVLEPGDAPAPDCLIIRQGAVEGSRPGEGGAAIAPGFSLGAGDLFPIGSLIGGRPPRTRYVASSDLFCWALAREHFEALMARSPVFADFCRRRMAALMELSMQVVQSHHAAQTAQWRLMGQALRGLIRRAPVGCRLDTRLGEALAAMEREEVGAMLVFDGSDPMPVGIFTRQDVIGRVVLPRVSLQAPISTVISRPVSVLPSSASVAEAILLMAEKTIRHVPVD